MLEDLNERAMSIEEVCEAVNEMKLSNSLVWMDLQWSGMTGVAWSQVVKTGYDSCKDSVRTISETVECKF